jgi:hypothetical protein
MRIFLVVSNLKSAAGGRSSNLSLEPSIIANDLAMIE